MANQFKIDVVRYRLSCGMDLVAAEDDGGFVKIAFVAPDGTPAAEQWLPLSKADFGFLARLAQGVLSVKSLF